MDPPTVKHISEYYIKPKHNVPQSQQPILLTPWDLGFLSTHYIQKGLLFRKPLSINSEVDNPNESLFLARLMDSLSLALVHFYPLAGQLSTKVDEEDHSCLVTIDCNKGPGARFIHATLDMTTYDILSPTYVPRIVHSFFDHDRAVNHDGHNRPLLSVQVTELTDGVFIGCSMNHVVGDGTSYWHFLNMWSEIYRAEGSNISISRQPIHQRCFLHGDGPIISLPFTKPEEFISRYEGPEVTERFLHFSTDSLAKLKAKANAESNTVNISTFQALSALIWRCITRARHLPQSQETTCKITINDRQRLDPPLSQDYFGNTIQAVKGVATTSQLLENSIGWAALLLHNAVVKHNNESVQGAWKRWMQRRGVYHTNPLSHPYEVTMGGSPRFEMYANEFGMGKALAVRSGYASKYNGSVTWYPGREGGVSIDLEICLPQDVMSVFERDEELIAHVSPSYLEQMLT